MRMFAAALGISALLIAGCGGGEEAGMEEMDEPAPAETMDEGAMEEMAPADTTMMDEGMPEEMEDEGGTSDEMGGGQ